MGVLRGLGFGIEYGGNVWCFCICCGSGNGARFG